MLLALALNACEGRATPVPAVPADAANTASAPAAPTEARAQKVTLTIGILSATAPYLRAEDRAALEAHGTVITVNDPESAEVDFLLAYGAFPGSVASGETHDLILALLPEALPANDLPLLALLREGFDPGRAAPALVDLGAQIMANTTAEPGRVRAALANAGLPDGLFLSGLNGQAPGQEAIRAAFFATGLELELRQTAPEEAVTALLQGRTQAALLLLNLQERSNLFSALGPEALFVIAQLPLHYRAEGMLAADRSPSGWPLPAKP